MSSDRVQAPVCPYPRAAEAGARPAPAPTDPQAVIDSLQEELIACQRLAVLGNMAAMVAHEFNNLLAPIVPRVEAALMAGDDVPYLRKVLERTLIQTRRAVAVSKHLLNLVQDNSSPTNVCTVAVALREALETLSTRPLEKDRIELRVSVPEDLHVRAREELLCQVLLNLLLNAKRALGSNGGLLSVTAVAVGECARIDVRDNGCGIPRDLLHNVINPFLAADPGERPNDWQQVGLGLSVCRLIAHRHQATIQAFANEDQGCTFRLCWPLADPATCTPAR